VTNIVKPVLDEQTLERLLEAAYVMQEHNRQMQELGESLELQSQQLRQQELASQVAARPKSTKALAAREDYTLTLAEIVETQRQIQMRHLELEQAMQLVAERSARITDAIGAGVATVEGKKVRYRAGSGACALPPGSEVSADKAICTASLRIGQIIRTEELNTEFFFDPDEARRRGIHSLISAPIYHEGNIVGAFELYFGEPKGFAEQDVHTCQLMAGLITEAFARNEERSWKKSLAAERATMLEALEKLKPNLAALSEAKTTAPPVEALAAGVSVEAKGPPCRKCGSKLGADEQFCGKCGTARVTDDAPPSLQSKVASAWQMQEANKESRHATPINGRSLRHEEPAPAIPKPEDSEPPVDDADDDLPALFTLPLPENDHAGFAAPDNPQQESEEETAAGEEPSRALARTDLDDATWSSAATAKQFLETLTTTRPPSALRRFWNARRGDFYLAIAVLLVAVVIRWGIWSDHAVGASGHGGTASGAAGQHKSDPNADLSMMDRLLISLGLAEAPEAPEYKGNPDTQVWVDLHTALYYCPGADLYGKTPKGKFTSQRDAQLDQFEPAYRKACD